MAAQVRILHIGPAPARPQGGIAAYVLGLLASPLATRYALDVVDVTVPETFRRHRALRPLLSAEFARRTWAALQRRRPALVHIHTSDYSGFWEKGALATMAARAGIPVVLHLHGGSFDVFLRALGPRQAAWARQIFAAAARVVVLSESWRPVVAEFVAPERIAILPNAIDVAAFAPPARTAASPSSPARLLFLGLLAQRKGLDDLWPALRAIDDLDWELDVVGGEEFAGERRRAEQAVRSHGLAARVHFRGPRDGAEKRAFLHAADIFVLPSRSESFGIANLEAMAAGLPVVSTRTGAIPEYLEHGVHGMLIAPGDVAALSAALRELIGSPVLRQRLGAAALVRARDYDWTAVEAQVARLYADVLARVSAGVR